MKNTILFAFIISAIYCLINYVRSLVKYKRTKHEWFIKDSYVFMFAFIIITLVCGGLLLAL